MLESGQAQAAIAALSRAVAAGAAPAPAPPGAPGCVRGPCVIGCAPLHSACGPRRGGGLAGRAPGARQWRFALRRHVDGVRTLMCGRSSPRGGSPAWCCAHGGAPRRWARAGTCGLARTIISRRRPLARCCAVRSRPRGELPPSTCTRLGVTIGPNAPARRHARRRDMAVMHAPVVEATRRRRSSAGGRCPTGGRGPLDWGGWLPKLRSSGNALASHVGMPPMGGPARHVGRARRPADWLPCRARFDGCSHAATRCTRSGLPCTPRSKRPWPLSRPRWRLPTAVWWA